MSAVDWDYDLVIETAGEPGVLKKFGVRSDYSIRSNEMFE